MIGSSRMAAPRPPTQRRRVWRAAPLLAATLLLALGAACARPQRLASVWRDPAFEGGSLRRPMVVAVGRTPRERRLFEDELTATLKDRGVDALPSYPYVGDERVDSALVDAAMHRTGCDGIFVSRLVDRQTVQRYYPPTPAGGYGYYAVPGAYHGGWWSYYSLGYGYAQTPGYTVTNQQVSVETNLYRQSDGRLVWSGLSRQWLSTSDVPGAESAPVVRELVAELIRSGVVQTAGGSGAAVR